MSVSKMLLGHSHAHFFIYGLGLFCAMMTDNEQLGQRPFVTISMLSAVAQQTMNCLGAVITTAFQVPCVSPYYDS